MSMLYRTTFIFQRISQNFNRFISNNIFHSTFYREVFEDKEPFVCQGKKREREERKTTQVATRCINHYYNTEKFTDVSCQIQTLLMKRH